MVAKQRFPLFDGLRALAATLVFVYHAWFLYHRPDCGLVECHAANGLVSGVWRAAVVNFGTQGVALFYVISGFLLYRQFVVRRQTAGLDWTTTRRYVLRRLVRVVPAYWLVMLVVGLTTVDSPMMHPAGFLQYMGFAQIYTQGALWRNPVPATWTVCVELTFYAFLPIWAYLMQVLVFRFKAGWRFELLALVGLATASVGWKLWVIGRGTVQNDFQPILVALPASLDVFAAGMALAVLSGYRVKLWRFTSFQLLAPRIALGSWSAAVAGFAAMCWLAAFDGPLAGQWQLRALSVALLKIPVAVGIVLPGVITMLTGSVAQLLSFRGVAWAGVVSYGLYLWHVPILRFVGQLGSLGPASSYVLVALTAVVAYAASLAVASLSWRLVESPVIDYVRNALGRDRAESGRRGRRAALIDA